MSYAVIKWSISDEAAVGLFRKALEPLIGLQIYVHAQKRAAYTPFLILGASALVQCDIQFSARAAAGCAILARWLIRSTTLTGCHLFASFADETGYVPAVFARVSIVRAHGCIVDVPAQAVSEGSNFLADGCWTLSE